MIEGCLGDGRDSFRAQPSRAQAQERCVQSSASSLAQPVIWTSRSFISTQMPVLIAARV
jgi:hypothetical protein